MSLTLFPILTQFHILPTIIFTFIVQTLIISIITVISCTPNSITIHNFLWPSRLELQNTLTASPQKCTSPLTSVLDMTLNNLMGQFESPSGQIYQYRVDPFVDIHRSKFFVALSNFLYQVITINIFPQFIFQFLTLSLPVLRRLNNTN